MSKNFNLAPDATTEQAKPGKRKMALAAGAAALTVLGGGITTANYAPAAHEGTTDSAITHDVVPPKDGITHDVVSPKGITHDVSYFKPAESGKNGITHDVDYNGGAGITHDVGLFVPVEAAGGPALITHDV